MELQLDPSFPSIAEQDSALNRNSSVTELHELELVLVGGGIAEVCPH